MKPSIICLFIFTLAFPCFAQNIPKKPKDFIDSIFPSLILKFLIPEKTKGQLISIEFENPDCKTLKWKEGILEFKIKKTGNLCISNGLSVGSPDEEFYVIDSKGNRNIAKVQEQIFNPEIKLLSKNGKGVIVFQFFYGNKKLLSKANSF